MRSRFATEPIDTGSPLRKNSDLDLPSPMVTPMKRLVSMGEALQDPAMVSPKWNGVPVSRKSSTLSWDEEDYALLGLGDGCITISKKEVRGEDTSSEEEVTKPPRVSLSEPGWHAWLCCQFSGACLFSIIAIQLVCAAVLPTVFLFNTAVLSVYVYLWTTNMAIFSAVGAWRMRRECAKDWHALLCRAQEDSPGPSKVMHIVIIPNYKEDEDMLEETLVNIGRSPSASSSIRVVLGMEAREGSGGREKADRLIAKTQHLFADIFATYHPPGLPGELAGKSSNTQWAYRAVLKRYKVVLESLDATRVFLSIGDADTLWNPQYFDALAVQALTMPADKVSWMIWQPPMLLFRNIFAVPGVTRLAGMGTLLFELAGLANQHIGSHFCFSSYSLSLALAKHKEVCGWDTDVVAEDHHMFAKCFFAPLWAAAEDPKAVSVEPQVELRPVYLPALGYLVESSAGYKASCKARFQQARRHAQGVAELGYVLQQYTRLVGACGASRLPIRTHRQILAIMWKMATVHIVNAVQAFSLIIAGVFAAAGILAGVWVEGFSSVWVHGGYHFAAGGSSASEVAKGALFATFGPTPHVAILTGGTIYLVVRDVIEGRYLFNNTADECEKGKLTSWQRFCLAVGLQRDLLFFGEPTVVIYGLVPEVLACWSLLRQGMRFEYIVAAKPGDTS